MARTLTAIDVNYRPSVGIMLLNGRGEVLVARRIDVPDAWQMPQGGIDQGESPREAALRELREEIGTDKAEIVGESATWLRYDLPEPLLKNTWDKPWRGQRQKWFVMHFTGTDSDINLQTQNPEFSAWKWVPADDLPHLIVSFKRQVYLDLLAEFPEIGKPLDKRLSELLDDPIIRIVMAADRVDERELYELLRRVSEKLGHKSS
ncbi:MAG: RNA pyrophosphohydrolase [Proteobacteria bacterium]|nr:RNA pyrophosphohydrolase [Pseudomonadota bacterium]